MTNRDFLCSSLFLSSDCNSGRALGEQFGSQHYQQQTSQETSKGKVQKNLQNNIQFAATLQRMHHQQQQQQQGCRSNSIYVIENHYSQPIYSDAKTKLQATEV